MSLSSMFGRGARVAALAMAALLSLAPASAQEAITYTYDVHGRVVQVARSGTVNNGVTASYTYDAADNRTNVTVATSGGGGTHPSFSVNDVSVTEGGNLVFTVTKSGTATTSYSVNYATASGSATAGSDYTAASGTLTFAASETEKTVTVVTIDDTTAESAETVLLNLSGVTGGATISDSQGVGTISDNDSTATCGGVSFAVSSNAAVTEGVSSVFTVTKSGSTSNSCSVNYASANGTAVAPGDYTAKSGTLTFTSVQTSQTISVTTIDDTNVESAETFTMSLSNATGGASIGTASATATINDNDSVAAPSFAVSDASANEGETLVFVVSRAGSTSGSYTVNYATASGTAGAGTHYVATSGTLTFAANETSKSVNVATIDDSQSFNTEYTMYLNISGASGGATISDSQGAGTIWENDGCGGMCLMSPGGTQEPTLEEAPLEVTEEEQGE